jgi:hypothetical protein
MVTVTAALSWLVKTVTGPPAVRSTVSTVLVPVVVATQFPLVVSQTGVDPPQSLLLWHAGTQALVAPREVQR